MGFYKKFYEFENLLLSHFNFQSFSFFDGIRVVGSFEENLVTGPIEEVPAARPSRNSFVDDAHGVLRC